MQRQFEILNELAQIFSDEAGCDYQCLVYKGEVDAGDGWVESTFSLQLNGEKKSVFLSEVAEDKVSSLIFDLHDVMGRHTGGYWKWMTLSIGEDRTAKVHFEYD